jgi:hypothetical protein
VTVQARRRQAGLTIEVANRERGRGLAIATTAAGDAGARLSVRRADGEFRATLDLPAAP